MTTKSLRHISHYIVLLIILMAGLIAMIGSGKSTLLHTIILIIISASYLVWGVIHHFIEKELHIEIVLEYLIFSLLGTVFVLGVLYYL